MSEYDQYYVRWFVKDHVYGDMLKHSTVVWARSERDAINQVKFDYYGPPDQNHEITAEILTYELTEMRPR